MSITKALIIDSPHIERILSCEKTWEMRSTSVKQRGRIALIRKGSGLVVGTVEVVDVKGPLTRDDMLANQLLHRVDPSRIQAGLVDKYKYAWVLKDAQPLAKPVAYVHPSGAVIWVNLDDSVSRQLG
jgi:hypothetical protein